MKPFTLFAIFASVSIGSVPGVRGAEQGSPNRSSPSQSTTKGGKVDINTAEIPALEAIPEIGTNFANAVVAGRPFKSVDDLERILKIGPEKMNSLRLKVVASPMKTVTPPAPAEPDKNRTSENKPAGVNDGKATDRKDVADRYDRDRAEDKSKPKK